MYLRGQLTSSEGFSYQLFLIAFLRLYPIFCPPNILCCSPSPVHTFVATTRVFHPLLSIPTWRVPPASESGWQKQAKPICAAGGAPRRQPTAYSNNLCPATHTHTQTSPLPTHNKQPPPDLSGCKKGTRRVPISAFARKNMLSRLFGLFLACHLPPGNVGQSFTGRLNHLLVRPPPTQPNIARMGRGA